MAQGLGSGADGCPELGFLLFLGPSQRFGYLLNSFIVFFWTLSAYVASIGPEC